MCGEWLISFLKSGKREIIFSKTSGAASAIMRTMLNEPGRRWQVKQLEELTGKAIGTVSNVKRFLQDRDWIKEGERGYQLCNIREMLFAWARDYHKKDSRTYECYSLDSLPQLEQKISKWSNEHDRGVVLGGFSAAARYAPTVRYRRAEVYVEQPFFEEFVKDLELEEVHSGGNILITIPHDETPCMFCRNIHDTPVTSPVQTVLDLLGNKGRGRGGCGSGHRKSVRREIRMERNEELKKAVDYSEGQKEAAYMVLGEIANLLGEYSEHIRIIGGWVPNLLYPEGDHIGVH